MESNRIYKLIFIYNANSGKRNAVLDSMHKILSPSTFDCNLCDITFGVFNENSQWKEFRSTYPIEMEFLHKDEFEKDYASKYRHRYTYPIVLGDVSGELQILVNTEELNKLTQAAELINLVEARAPVT